jgi:hypothetical protein
VIDLQENAFKSLPVTEVIHPRYPVLRYLAQVDEGGYLMPVRSLLFEGKAHELVFTFEEFLRRTPFADRIRRTLKILETHYHAPVDTEFTVRITEPNNLHPEIEITLLQCRPQSHLKDREISLPDHIPAENIIFSTHRMIPEGRIDHIRYVVFVSPEGYFDLPSEAARAEVGHAISRLNSALAGETFICIGPGRWGTRNSDLGVFIGYSDIYNTRALVELAGRGIGVLPEPSFGTHFFQDLVEADIRYIPLYPDDPDILFDELFLRRSRNILPDILPEFAAMAEVVRVIDVPAEASGQVLHILLNADLDQAVGILGVPAPVKGGAKWEEQPVPATREEHWRWRLRMAEKIAAHLDTRRFSVRALYVFGSAKNATAGPASDLDLIVYFNGTDRQREELSLWLDGWSRSLAEINYLRTGYAMDGLLDVHFVTDADIARGTSYAAKINAVTDAARELPLGRRASRP